jgi:hypothetical protein
VTSDKEGTNSVFERELPDADIVISQPFWPAYLTAERIAKAKKLRLALTAGIGSDHVDLEAAIKHGRAEQMWPNILYWNEVDRGGHFAAFEQPEIFTANCARRSEAFVHDGGTLCWPAVAGRSRSG